MTQPMSINMANAVLESRALFDLCAEGQSPLVDEAIKFLTNIQYAGIYCFWRANHVAGIMCPNDLLTWEV